MALYKSIINDMGIETTYHRIYYIEIRYNNIFVDIASYTNDSIRNMEKELNANLFLNDELNNKIIEESQKEEPDTELIEELTNKVNSLNLELNEYIFSHNYVEVPYSEGENISFDSIYTKLKQYPMFDGAEDC